ncbi:hypothetical protein OHR68_05090 [Spirillospora sp. NBC_00431]
MQDGVAVASDEDALAARPADRGLVVDPYLVNGGEQFAWEGEAAGAGADDEDS